MDIFNWLSDLFPDSTTTNSITNANPLDEHAINPATGLPMVGGTTAGVDIEGNVYGTDSSHFDTFQDSFSDSFSNGIDDTFSSSLDNSFSSGSGINDW